MKAFVNSKEVGGRKCNFFKWKYDANRKFWKAVGMDSRELLWEGGVKHETISYSSYLQVFSNNWARSVFWIDLFIAKSVNELTVRHVIYPKVYDCTAVDCIYQSE